MKILKTVIYGLLLLWILLVLTGWGVLLSETKVSKGDRYPAAVAKDYGEVNNDDGAALVCKYFDGRSLLSKVFWYSPNGILGKSSCPVWNKRDS
jgi:hypothetical protein